MLDSLSFAVGRVSDLAQEIEAIRLVQTCSSEVKADGVEVRVPFTRCSSVYANSFITRIIADLNPTNLRSL